MAFDTINGRIRQKRDTTAHWNQATGFIPLQGEIIVYTDYQTIEEETNLYDRTANPIEQGAISSSNGADSSSGTRVRSDGFVSVASSTAYTIESNLENAFVLFYTSAQSYITRGGSTGWMLGGGKHHFTTPSTCEYIRFVLANEGNTAVTPSDVEWVKLVDPSQTKTVEIAGIKIGSGNAYVQDLAFIDEDTRKTLAEHIDDWDVHVTTADRTFWNNKVTTVDSVVDETLIFTRS